MTRIFRYTSPEFFLAKLIYRFLSKNITFNLISGLLSITMFLIKNVGIFRSFTFLNKMFKLFLNPKDFLNNLRILIYNPFDNPIFNPIINQQVMRMT
jgi:hypothetical protein